MMRKRRVNPVQEPLTKNSCRHYWIIESARGPVSKGVCKFCGAQKEFHNSWPYFPVGRPSEKPPEISVAIEEGNSPEELE